MKEGNKHIQFRVFQAERNKDGSKSRETGQVEYCDVKKEGKSATEGQLEEERKGPQEM